MLIQMLWMLQTKQNDYRQTHTLWLQTRTLSDISAKNTELQEPETRELASIIYVWWRVLTRNDSIAYVVKGDGGLEYSGIMLM